MKESDKAAYARGMAAAMAEGGVYVPASLLRNYRKVGLSELEAMLLLQLMLYRQAEHVEFPTLEQLAERLAIGAEEIAGLVQRLMKEGFLAIEESYDAATGVQSEAYHWHGWLARTAALVSSGEVQQAWVGTPGAASNGGTASSGAGGSSSETAGMPARKVPQQLDVFSVFEQEFGRPLSPMELETISGWLDNDRYPEELIRFALKEAVFAGKLHFRYIDRILLEWSRNRVTNTEEARAHAQSFRSGKG